MKLDSLDELRVFVQIVDSGSLTGAARALKLPPNTVSRRLASLENRLDTRLIHRTTRSMSVSETGRALVVRARRILDEVESAERAILRETEGITGVVRVSVVSVLAVPATLTAIRELMDRHPGLRVHLQVNDRPVNPVAEGLDVVVIGGRLDDSTLVARKLADVELLLAASEGYLARRGLPTTPQDLLDHDTIHFRTGGPALPWRLVGPQGREHVVSPEGRFEANDGRALFDALRSGLGIGLTSRRMLVTDARLSQVLTDYALPPVPLYAVYPAANKRSARLQAVVEALVDAAQVR